MFPVTVRPPPVGPAPPVPSSCARGARPRPPGLCAIARCSSVAHIDPTISWGSQSSTCCERSPSSPSVWRHHPCRLPDRRPSRPPGHGCPYRWPPVGRTRPGTTSMTWRARRPGRCSPHGERSPHSPASPSSRRTLSPPNGGVAHGRTHLHRLPSSVDRGRPPATRSLLRRERPGKHGSHRAT